MVEFPRDFRCKFLIAVSRAFAARSKAIKHRGVLKWDRGEGDVEWLAVMFRAPGRPWLMLELGADQRGDVIVRSMSRSSRGKTLVRLEGLTFVNNAAGIVEAFERTVSVMGWLDGPLPKVESVVAAWSPVTLRTS